MTSQQTKQKALELARTYWITGKEINGYTVHKMSYGDYFLEPITWQGGETHGFSPKTLWLDDETNPRIDRISYEDFINLTK